MIRSILMAALLGSLLLAGAGCTAMCGKHDEDESKKTEWLDSDQKNKQDVNDRDLGAGADKETLPPAK